MTQYTNLYKVARHDHAPLAIKVMTSDGKTLADMEIEPGQEFTTAKYGRLYRVVQPTAWREGDAPNASIWVYRFRSENEG